MAWPSTSAENKCGSSRNRHLTEFLCASITCENNGRRILDTRIHPEDVVDDAQRSSHPDQRPALQVPDLDQAPGTAAVNGRGVDPHTLDRSGMLEVTFLHMSSCLQTPHWQSDGEYRAHVEASLRFLVTTLSKRTTD